MSVGFFRGSLAGSLILFWMTPVELFADSTSDSLEPRDASQTQPHQHHSDVISYGSLLWGDGRGGDGHERSMQWQAFEQRFGTELNERFRLDIVHYNEGKPENNHRDGFAAQGVYTLSPGENFGLELALGPYLSFNTTTRETDISSTGIIELNDKNLGVLVSVGLRYHPDFLGRRAHLRLQYNHVEMPHAPDSDALLAGIGFDFDSSRGGTNEVADSGALDLAVFLSHFVTNHGGTSSAQGFHLEARKNIWQQLDLSIGYIKEGEDELVDRQGIPLQLWYAGTIGDKWSLGAGLGPYFSSDRDDGGVDLNGIISLEAKRRFTNGLNLVFRFSRIMDINSHPYVNQEIDRDMFEIGISKSFL